jgi:hypothetical protein
VAAALAATLIVTMSSCREYRVEYHKRPAFYEKAALGELPREVVLDDGTVIKYSDYHEQSTMGRGADEGSRPFQIREEMEDGSIVLRAILPDHVVVNTLECLRNEEYDVLWDQMLSDRVKQDWEERGGGKDGCGAYFRKNRHELVASLTRMAAGSVHQEVRFTQLGNGVTRCQLRPQYIGDLKFTWIEIVKEGPGLKLLMIGAK